MKEAMRRSGPVVAIRRQGERKRRWFTATYCSICKSRIWFDPVDLIEPEGAPEPRHSWTLCKPCYQALLLEMRRSPVLSPLRLRIAVGIVASERWPQAYPTRIRSYISDRKWIIFIAAGFIVAMIIHLALIVMVAGMK